ncbi:MAG: hypothetical protein PHI34_03905 [Acidobacteriota bacterium]|nr:hypothetical protein [Acidobacteriota bacterium]
MLDRLKSKLPILAVAGVIVFLITLIFEANRQPAFQIDSGANRPAALALLSELEQIRPDTPGDVRLEQWADRAERTPEIVRADVYAADGRVVHFPSKKGPSALLPGKGPSNIKDMVSSDVFGALDALADGDLRDDQKTLLLAAFAIRAEGEHNDIYRHLVRPVRNQAGEIVAVAGIAYAIGKPASGQSGTALWLIRGLAMVLGFAVYLLSLAAWVLLDAKGRERHPWLWAGFVLVGQFIGLLVYLLIRKNGPAEREA